MIAPALRFPRLVTTMVLIRALGVVTAALLAIDAYVHLRDAGLYDAGTGITEGALFRVEAYVAVVVALALLVRPHRVVWVIALLVAAGAAAAIYLYTYVDVGALGPLPNMYEPTWALPGKRLAAAAETAATATAALGLAVTVLGCRRTDRPVRDPQRAVLGDMDIEEGCPMPTYRVVYADDVHPRGEKARNESCRSRPFRRGAREDPGTARGQQGAAHR